MLTFAAQTFAADLATIAPEEPASLSMALIAVGTIVLFGALSGWRFRRSPSRVAAKICLTYKPTNRNERRIRYAA